MTRRWWALFWPPRLGAVPPAWLLLLFILLAYVHPYFTNIPNPNERTRYYLTHALVTRGEIVIDQEIDRYGDTLDKSKRAGHFYCDKAPGISFLAVPVMAAFFGWAHVLGFEATPSLTLYVLKLILLVGPLLWMLAGFYRLLGQVVINPRWQAAVWWTTALGTLLYTFSIVFFSHGLAAALIGGALVWLAGEAALRRPVRTAWVAGFLLSYAVVCEYPAVAPGLALGLYAVHRLRWRALWMAAPALLCAALLLFYHQEAFGSPWATGYSYLTNTFAKYHSVGLFGFTTPHPKALGGLLFSYSRGLFILAPWLMLLAPGSYYLWRHNRPLTWAALGGALLLWLLIGSMEYWQGGGTIGPRHLTPLAPLAALLAAPAAERLSARRPALGMLIAAVMLLSIIITVGTTIPFPFASEKYPNPFRDLALPLWSAGVVPFNAGRLLGLTATWSMAPFILLLLIPLAMIIQAAVVEGLDRWRKISYALFTVALAFALISVYRLPYRARDRQTTTDRMGIVQSYTPEDGWAKQELARAKAQAEASHDPVDIWRVNYLEALAHGTLTALHGYQKEMAPPAQPEPQK